MYITDMETNIIMEDLVGGKRRGDSNESQFELLKKREVSQEGKKNKLILVEAEPRPARTNE